MKFLFAAWRTVAGFWEFLSRILLGIVAIAIGWFATSSFGHVSSSDIAEYLTKHLSTMPYGAIDWATNSVIAYLLVALAIVGVAWLHSQLCPKGPTGSSADKHQLLLDDGAISGGGTEPDEFEWGSFTDSLCRTLVLPSGAKSLVVGLEAPWGSGKSSAISLLCRKLSDDERIPLVVHFSPWVITGRDGIFRAFFSQFAASLRNRGEVALATGLLRFGETLNEISPPSIKGIPALGLSRVRRLMGQIPPIDLEGGQQEFNAQVERVDRPIVVVIDDIDRLPPDDIRELFQLVKAVAAFPRVSYLLAYDPKPIDAALEFQGVYKVGSEYREKIIQANIRLPRIRYLLRERFFRQLLDKRIGAWGFILSEAEKTALEQVIPKLLAALRTPRDIKRVLNKTFLSAENIRGEVNFADVVAFETLHTIFPEVVQLITSNPRAIRAGDNRSDGSEEYLVDEIVKDDAPKEGEKIDRAFRNLVSLYPGRELELVPLLVFMFGASLSKKGSLAARLSEQAAAARDGRISVRRNLLKLLYQSFDGETLSTVEAIRFIEEPAQRAAQLADYVARGSLSSWLSYAEEFLPKESEVPDARGLVLAVCEATNAQFRATRVDSSEDAWHFVYKVLNSMRVDAKKELLQELVDMPECVSISEQALVHLLHGTALWNGEVLAPTVSWPASSVLPWITNDELDSLRKGWLLAVKSLGISELMRNYPGTLGILFRWGQLADAPYAEVREELERSLMSEANARHFLLLFPPGVSWSGVQKLLTRSALEAITAAIGKSEVPNAFRENFEEFADWYRQSRSTGEGDETSDASEEG